MSATRAPASCAATFAEYMAAIGCSMTPEQAYNEDVACCPLYHDGTPRRPWHALPEHVRATWARNPTPRAYACHYCHQHHTPAGVRPVLYADGHAGAWRVYDDGRAYGYAVEVMP